MPVNAPAKCSVQIISMQAPAVIKFDFKIKPFASKFQIKRFVLKIVCKVSTAQTKHDFGDFVLKRRDGIINYQLLSW
jgi:hypothetical protein